MEPRIGTWIRAEAERTFVRYKQRWQGQLPDKIQDTRAFEEPHWGLSPQPSCCLSVSAKVPRHPPTPTLHPFSNYRFMSKIHGAI